MADEDSSTKTLGRLPVFYYGVGHMLNDITVSCWFTYHLVFITDIGLSPKDAAIVMLSGQIADALVTIFAGELIDRFGHFKIWHGAGSALVSISFSSVFGSCLPCKILGTHSAAMQTVGYSISAAIYNVGWAATQVSHMSMVNCITQNPTSRVALTSCRNAFTMIANLTLYGIALVVFSTKKSLAHKNIESQFCWIAYISIAIGCCFVGIFLIGTKEPRLKQDGIQGNTQQRVPWSHWFKKVLYYQVALVYVLTRLVTNVSQALLAFYVINDLQMAQLSKASVPAIIFVCSFIVSVTLQEITWSGNRLKAYFTAGSIIWILSGAGILILPCSMPGFMYLLSVTIGVANALMMKDENSLRTWRASIETSPLPPSRNTLSCQIVTSISMQSVLVGEDLSGCGVVYGSISFADKLLVGLALFVLESYESSSSSIQSCHSILSCLSVTRIGLGLVPAACALLASVVTYTMNLNTTPVARPQMDLAMA